MISADNVGILSGMLYRTHVCLPIQAPTNWAARPLRRRARGTPGCEDGASATLGGHTGDRGCHVDQGRKSDGHRHPYSRHHSTTERLPKAEVLGGLSVVGQPTQGGSPVVGRLDGHQRADHAYAGTADE